MEYFIIAIVLIFSAVPVGLRLAVRIAIAFSVNKMCLENNLVKSLEAYETIGVLTDICTDNTGTIT